MSNSFNLGLFLFYYNYYFLVSAQIYGVAKPIWGSNSWFPSTSWNMVANICLTHFLYTVLASLVYIVETAFISIHRCHCTLFPCNFVIHVRIYIPQPLPNFSCQSWDFSKLIWYFFYFQFLSELLSTKEYEYFLFFLSWKVEPNEIIKKLYLSAELEGTKDDRHNEANLEQ